jgi:cytoskeletal protein CcmA (bactofilin family)
MRVAVVVASMELRSSRSVVLLLVALTALAAFPGVATAETRLGGSTVVEEGETVSGLSVVSGSVVVHGTVDGNVEGVAGSVLITGRVTGDVQVATGSLVIAPDAVVEGSVQAGAGSVTIEGAVGGDVQVGAETVTVREGATVGGDLEYDAQRADIAAGTVAGSVVQRENLDVRVGPVPDFSPFAQPFFGIPQAIGAVYGLLASLLVGVLLLAAFPAFSTGVAGRVAESPARSGLIGLLALFAVPVALILLVITIIGIPLAVLGAILFGLAVWVGYIYGQFAVGAWLLERVGEENRWAGLVVGLLVVALLGAVPFVGGLLEFLVLLVGVGALASAWTAGYRSRHAGKAETA